MNLLKMYFQEKYSVKFIESDKGYIMYNTYEDNSVYVRHLYVHPDHRNENIGYSLEQDMIEKEKPWVIFCDIDLTSNGAEESMNKIIHKSGYEVDEQLDNKVILRKLL